MRLPAIAAFCCLTALCRADAVLESAAAVRALETEAANEARPVRVEGLITFIDSAAGRAFLLDQSAGISLKIAPPNTLPAELRAGSRVRVTGVTAAGQFMPRIEGPAGGGVTIEVLGQETLPPGRPVTGPQLIQPAMDSQWVEIWGVVRPPPAHYRGALLAIEAEGRTFFAYLPENASPRDLPPSLLGIRVQLRAVAGTFVNDRRQMTRRVLFLPSIDSITTEETLTLDDPFERPLTAFDDLLRAHTPGANERAKVRGTVTQALPDQGLFLREEGGGGLWVQTSQGFTAPAVAPGDVVEAVGWPEASDFRPDLRGSVFRVTTHGQPPPPIPAAAKELLTASHHADSVVTEATLIGLSQDPLGLRLLLNEGDVFFEARVPYNLAPEPLPGWVRDARLQVTGICENIPAETLTSPQSSQTFFIRIGALDDVVVLSSPSWWTPRRMIWALGIVVGCALLVSAWAMALRRRVAIQTKVIEAQVHRAGVQEERHRLARELHDSLEQEMTGVGLQLETALARIGSEPDAARNSIERARRLLHRTQRETRETIWDLRSSPTDPGVLPSLFQEALVPLAEAAEAQLEVSFSKNVPDGLSGTLMHHLARVAHEAVANAAKHGHPRHLRVSLDVIDGQIELIVRDDGCGFDQSGAPGARQGHFGLTGMQERAAKCGGSLSIRSSPGEGTEVRLTAPITNHSNETITP
jgi:signal transduction histidine kinase